MSSIAPSPLPRWDLSAAFPSLNSPEFARAFDQVKDDIARYAALVERAEASDTANPKSSATILEGILGFANDLHRRIRTIGSFIHGFVSTDSRNEEALAKDSELDIALIPYSKLSTRLTAWFASLPIDQLVQISSLAKDHEFMIRKAQISANHLMAPAEEALWADLAAALYGWSKLHGNITSQIEVELELKGELRRMSMSMVRNLAYDPDRTVRQTAHHAELASWKKYEVPLAAAMNGIKGTVNTLSQKRSWDSPLDESLFASNIDRKILEAMMVASREAFPAMRRYMQAKARLLRVGKLAFYDIFAPVGKSAKEWSFDEGANFVLEHFYSYSAKLGDYAKRSFDEKWIDAESRPGKRDGAFCMWLVGDQSRVMMNYKPAFGSVKTLAHELGHAYHNLCLSDRTMLQRRTPMTLAETASIFCETIVQNAAQAQADGEERLLLLEGSLQGICQTVVDITSRFLFEEQVFARRNDRDLSASEYCQIMLDAQRETYGDGLDDASLHPYMWAVKPHYYSGSSFYNYPYMYGLLFSLGLYAQFKQAPEVFKTKYDDLLSSTGMADAASLGRRFGIDVQSADFWRSSLDVVREQINAFEELVEQRA